METVDKENISNNAADLQQHGSSQKATVCQVPSEDWLDRVEVLTKADHQAYTAIATELVTDMIASAVSQSLVTKVCATPEARSKKRPATSPASPRVLVDSTNGDVSIYGHGRVSLALAARKRMRESVGAAHACIVEEGISALGNIESPAKGLDAPEIASGSDDPVQLKPVFATNSNNCPTEAQGQPIVIHGAMPGSAPEPVATAMETPTAQSPVAEESNVGDDAMPGSATEPVATAIEKETSQPPVSEENALVDGTMDSGALEPVTTTTTEAEPTDLMKGEQELSGARAEVDVVMPSAQGMAQQVSAMPLCVTGEELDAAFLPSKPSSPAQPNTGLDTADSLIDFNGTGMTPLQRHAPLRTPASTLRGISLIECELPVDTPRSRPKYSQRDMDEALTQVRREGEVLQAEFAKLLDDRASLTNQKEEMEKAMQEYSQTIESLMAVRRRQHEEQGQSLFTLEKQRDQLRGDLEATEKAFQSLMGRYNALKTVNENLQKNEEALKDSVAKHQEALHLSEERYSALVKHAEAKIEMANQKIADDQERHSKDIASMEAKLTKAEFKTATLEKQLNSKIEENKELTKMCDELISKLG